MKEHQSLILIYFIIFLFREEIKKKQKYFNALKEERIPLKQKEVPEQKKVCKTSSSTFVSTLIKKKPYTTTQTDA
jgi:hypothetical protein